MSAPPTQAMVLAAGLGTRMRPLTDDRPKALVEVGGRPLIDWTLEKLEAAGVTTAVVNVHYCADQVEAHLARRPGPMRIVVSDERDGLLDSGGGIAKARPFLTHDAIYVANIDNVWIDHGRPALQQLADAWDPQRMDIAILLSPRGNSYGFERPEGFLRADAGALTHSNSADPLPPFNNIGFQILKPGVLDGQSGAFSIVPIWKRLQAERRLYGAVMDSYAVHVSDPAGRDYAERRLAEEAAR